MITDRDDLLRARDRRPRLRRLGPPRRRPAALPRLELPRLRDPGRGRARAAGAARRAARSACARTRHGWPSASRELPGLTPPQHQRRRRRRGHLPDRLRTDARTRRRGRRRRSRRGCPGDAHLRRRTSIDLHVYPFWKPVLDVHRRRRPAAPDCPRTLDLLERAIHVDVSPLNDEQRPRRDRVSRSRRWRPACSRDGPRRRRRRRASSPRRSTSRTSPRCATASRLRALAEPSETVREALGARYGIPGLYADYRTLLDAGGARRDRRLLACRHARRGGARRARRGAARLRREADVHHARRRRPRSSPLATAPGRSSRSGR